MPTYSNGTTHLITWQETAWAPGETQALPFFVPHAALGLVKVSDEPYPPDPVALSQDLSFAAAGEQEVLVPEGLEAFTVSFMVLEGTGEVRCNRAEGLPAVLDAGKGIDYVRRFRGDEVFRFLVRASGKATIRVLLEREGF